MLALPIAARARVALLLVAVVSPTLRPGRASLAAPPPARPALRQFVDSIVNAPDFANAHWGILIVDATSHDTLYAHDAGRLLMPASNMKLLTAGTALAQLGAGYAYHTRYVATGPQRGDTLDGDLLVVAGGDPSISDHMRGDAMLPLRDAAQSLADRGIRHIRGGVIGVDSLFPGSHLGYGWSYDDFTAPYAAPVGALLFNEGASEIVVRGGNAVGDPVTVETRPTRDYPRVSVAATTARPPAGAPRDQGTIAAHLDSATWTFVVDGAIAPHDSVVVAVPQHDPTAAFIAAVTQALTEHGIDVERQTAAHDRADTLVDQPSLPLAAILSAMLKPSQNQIAEMVFRGLALHAQGLGRADSAASVVQRQLAAWGVPPADAIVHDGSGLSRYDYVTPRAIVTVLDAMRHLPDSAAFSDALPVAGVGGTLAGRLRGTPAQGNARAKTGSAAATRSLSGYVTTANHHILIFSLLCNNYSVPGIAVERAQDAIVARLAALRTR